MHAQSHGFQRVKCMITGQSCRMDDAMPVDLIRKGVVEKLKQKAPEWDAHGYVSLDELNKARMEHIDEVLEGEQDDLSRLRNEVAHSIKEHESLARNADLEFDKSLSFGERLADKIATFGGSWTFIIIFGAIIFVWTAVNSWIAFTKPFDPYPFILLNLVLSCLAALQAPVIMMSQNRQESKDRMRSENDYKVNLKAELEIQAINEKIDRLINDQWKHLLEIQRIQMEMIEEMSKGKNGKG